MFHNAVPRMTIPCETHLLIPQYTPLARPISAAILHVVFDSRPLAIFPLCMHYRRDVALLAAIESR
jgi:hypothetical protein